MSTALEYGPDIREGHKFGFGTFTDRTLVDPSEEEQRTLALKLGWSNGCPIASELTGPDSPYPLEWMINRYSETNQWFKLITDRAVRFHPLLARVLLTPKPRHGHEPVGKHDPLVVPKSHLSVISPMSGIVGYSAPRVLIEARGANTPEGGIKADDILMDTLAKTTYSPEFLPKLCEAVVTKAHVAPEKVLHHAYAQGILAEQNTQIDFYMLAGDMEYWAPTVWKAYLSLTDTQKDSLQIAKVPPPYKP